MSLGDELVDQKRSCLKITYVSPPPPHEHDSEDEEDVHDHDEEEQGPELTVNLANLIPGVVRFPQSSVCGSALIWTLADAGLVHCVFGNFLVWQIETQSLGGLIINAGEKVILQATGKK